MCTYIFKYNISICVCICIHKHMYIQIEIKKIDRVKSKTCLYVFFAGVTIRTMKLTSLNFRPHPRTHISYIIALPTFSRMKHHS